MSMFVDETATDVPVKDINLSFFSQAGAQESLVNQNARERQAISRVSREELEDKFLRLHEENLLLKQHGHNQEDKIKRLATKLVKLVKDRRRMEQLVAGSGGAPRPPAPAAGRDVEMEEMMEELQDKVRALQQQNEGLKQRLLVAKQQLQVQSRKPVGPYGRVQSRVNTGLKRQRDDSPTLSPMPPRGTRNVEVEGSGRPPTGLLPRYGHSLLEEARAEIRNLENVMERQQGDIEDMMRESEFLRDKLRRKEKEYEESLLQLREQQTTGQRSTIHNNVEMIKLQKQLTEKANAMTVLEGRFLQLQESQKTMKASHDAVMAKVDELTVQLKDERLKSVGLESQLQTVSIAQRRTEELQEQINDLEKERDLLKENCDKLVNSAFDVSQEQKWRLREQQLKLQIAQLEVALKADLTDKNEILDKIKAERDANEKLTEENKRLEIRFLEQKQQLEEVGERLAFYTKESELDAAELSEALMLIKVRRSQKRGELGFLQQVEEEAQGDTTRSMGELQAMYVDTYQDLEKTRDMLIVQHKINKDYQAEVEAATQKLESAKIEYELRLDQQAQLLDMRAAKIKKLEAQLKNIAYGTKAYVFTPDITDEDVADEFDETVHLERGENLLEIHIGNGALSSSALEALGDREPSTFCTYAFYDFELHATPVVHGSRPAYGFTSQYVVRVDDVFLQYLHTRSVTVELHLAKGMDFQTVAAGQLQLQQLLEKDGKVYGEVQLVGVYGEVQSFGSVEYWARLRVPMEQAIQLYKERVKALGYISTTRNEEKQASATNLTPQLASPGSSSTNELNVTIRCCCNLSVQGGRPPPSSYVVYRFFDFPDHDTRVVPDCCEPRFDDHVSYPVAMDADLDGYLKAKSLQLYVFDDQEEKVDTYLGKAQVPLLSLAHDKAITGLFELIDPSGRSVGHIELTLKWKFTYLPPPGSTMTVEQAKFIPRDKAVKLTNEAEGTRRHDVKEGKREEKNTKEVELKEEEEEKETETTPHLSASLPAMSSAKAPLPKPRLKPQTKQKPVSKRVTFIDNTTTEEQLAERSMENVPLDKGGNAKLPPVKVVDVTPAPPSTEDVTPTPPHAEDVTPTPLHAEDVTPAPLCAEEKGELEDEDEEVTHFSEGQLIPSVSGPSARSYSDDSEISEDIIEEDIEGAPAEGEDQSQSIQSDSDDCIVPGQASAGRKPAQCLRVEIASLSLRPESRAARDPSVVRLFVEYSLLDLPSEETPLSLPKPQPGKSSHYHYSNVIHMDVENNRARRELLKAVLEGRNPQMDSIRFTVVSEPPEEEEQERECEDVGLAYLRIPDILEKQRDLIETNLNVVDVEDTSSVVGSLMVSVEGLEALQSIMEDPDHDYTPVSSLQTLTSDDF